MNTNDMKVNKNTPVKTPISSKRGYITNNDNFDITHTANGIEEKRPTRHSLAGNEDILISKDSKMLDRPRLFKRNLSDQFSPINNKAKKMAKVTTENSVTKSINSNDFWKGLMSESMKRSVTRTDHIHPQAVLPTLTDVTNNGLLLLKEEEKTIIEVYVKHKYHREGLLVGKEWSLIDLKRRLLFLGFFQQKDMDDVEFIGEDGQSVLERNCAYNCEKDICENAKVEELKLGNLFHQGTITAVFKSKSINHNQ